MKHLASLYSFVFKRQGEIGLASYIISCVSNLIYKCIGCDKQREDGVVLAFLTS